MSKVITSPVTKWPGTVTLSDPLTLPQAIAMEQAIDAASELGENASLRRYHYAIAPGICACVEAWNLEGLGALTPETFPGSPKEASAKLAAWLLNEITALYHDAEDVPNE